MTKDTFYLLFSKKNPIDFPKKFVKDKLYVHRQENKIQKL